MVPIEFCTKAPGHGRHDGVGRFPAGAVPGNDDGRSEPLELRDRPGDERIEQAPGQVEAPEHGVDPLAAGERLGWVSTVLSITVVSSTRSTSGARSGPCPGRPGAPLYSASHTFMKVLWS
ncbi:MAG: hypothetical protein ACREJ9_17260 [Candidatus Rokuibacteriota bacterium]